MTDTKRVAFTLREAYAGTVTTDGEQRPQFSGGMIRAGDRDLNVGELLEQGKGTLVLDAARDRVAIAALDEYPPLKRTTTPAEPRRAAAAADKPATTKEA